MRKSFLLSIGVLVASLILTGCQPQPTQTPDTAEPFSSDELSPQDYEEEMPLGSPES